MKELWRPITGFEGRYEISNLGRVKSLARWVKHPRGSKRLLGTHILKTHPTARGYISVALYVDETHRQNMNVHRMVASAFIPNPKGLPEVDHLDKNRANNQVDNLDWVSRLDNVVKGEKHPFHKLTNSEVYAIRGLLNQGVTQTVLGEQFSVSQSAISRIKIGRTWRGI